MSFDINWEEKVYKKKKQINKYPFDWVVSSVSKYINKKKKNIACIRTNSLFVCVRPDSDYYLVLALIAQPINPASFRKKLTGASCSVH